MDVVQQFGRFISDNVDKHPVAMQRVLTAGYAGRRWALQAIPDKHLTFARQDAARITMDCVLGMLTSPQTSAAISLFVPCEIMQAAGINCFSVELLSAFLSGTQCEQKFLTKAGEVGFPETLCSYHRTFLGALESGIVPAPEFGVYTNVACDGNLITFRQIEKDFQIPVFFIDVPTRRTEEAVKDVADQLRHLTRFVSAQTGHVVSEDDIAEHVARSKRTAQNFLRYTDMQRDHLLVSDMTSEMYSALIMHPLLGTEAAERYSEELVHDISEAPAPGDALRLVWCHLIPNMLAPVTERLDYSTKAYVAACDIAVDALEIVAESDENKPYEAMARRLVYACMNGNFDIRIRRIQSLVERTDADGVVLFSHWGCKATSGSLTLMQHVLDKHNIPSVILDGDGCDRTNSPEGQVATRLDAFLEMLSARKREKASGQETPEQKASEENASARKPSGQNSSAQKPPAQKAS